MIDIKKKSWRFGRFRLTVDPLLLLILILLTWLLSARYYPRLVFVRPAYFYWVMGTITSLALTFSILIHELGHAFTAQRFNLPIERIHLFLFGGMAELRHRPVKPSQEFFVALSGPAASLLVAVAFYGISFPTENSHPQVYYVLQNIGFMNALLGIFNLIPIYPLDGGRAMRALIWWKTKWFYRASRLTYKVGKQIIIVLFIATVVLYFTSRSNIAFWMGIFGFYMAYTILSGRKELNYVPNLKDLIMSTEHDATPTSIINAIRSINEAFLDKSIIPVMEDMQIKYVLYGKEIIEITEEDPLDNFIQPVMPGTYMETQDFDTYKPGILFQAEYIPVFKSGVLQGLCDAHEMRFWLLDKYAPERFE